MKRNVTRLFLFLALLFGPAVTSSAEVKQVRMRVTGYLCNL